MAFWEGYLVLEDLRYGALRMGLEVDVEDLGLGMGWRLFI